ncbi:G-protein coupled receptor 143-like [Ahaetulla prasina]|uniref:G-protein coupled receptor 143-like n=1 Tax=Ahaetulla prasina TaxID=499056 RepID=UPI00264926BE|nr:G-protein coupled receptor 143-like [Ahaetulla prasina]
MFPLRTPVAVQQLSPTQAVPGLQRPQSGEVPAGQPGTSPMASPRALGLCCAPPGSPAAAAGLVRLSRQLPPWPGLALGSAALGLLAAALLAALCRRPRHRCSGSCRVSAGGGWAPGKALRTAALLGSFLGTAGILARSLLWLAAPLGSVPPLCRLIVVWVQFGFSSHFWALFCYSLEAALLLQKPTSHRSLTPYCLLCWGLPAIQGLLGLLLLMKPQDMDCSSHHGLAWILETVCYASSFVPLTLVFLGSPVLFYKALQAVPALLRRVRGMQTAGEWRQQQELRSRLMSIMVTFAACWLANVLHELLLLLLELEPLERWGIGQLLHGAALACWAVMIILNPLSGALMILAFSSWKSMWWTRKQAPTWRPSVEIPGGSRALEPALGCRIEPGPLEVSSLLISFGSSTSLDFLCEWAGDCPIQPQSQHEQSCHEDSTPPPVSSCSCPKDSTWAGSNKGGEGCCTPPAWPATPIHGGPASPTSPRVQVQAGDGKPLEEAGPSCVGSRLPSNEETL